MKATVGENGTNIDRLGVSLVEFPGPLCPGDTIGKANLLVVEVRRLRSTMRIGGAERSLFVAVHAPDERGRATTLFVRLEGDQDEWPATSKSESASDP
jgi:hypothetical protein